jgi:hypothetical protein
VVIPPANHVCGVPKRPQVNSSHPYSAPRKLTKSYSRDGNEAFAQPFHPRLKEIKKVYQARGISGVPLVLDGQTVLGGAPIPANALDQHRQRLVAVCTDNGEAFLKRVGDPLLGLPHLRLFESVGGLGDARVVEMRSVENGDSRLPRFAGAREVVGVIYS